MLDKCTIYIIFVIKDKIMIQIFLKDETNPYREDTLAYETYSPIKAHKFIRSLKSMLLKKHWSIKTKIGGVG